MRNRRTQQWPTLNEAVGAVLDYQGRCYTAFHHISISGGNGVCRISGEQELELLEHYWVILERLRRGSIILIISLKTSDREVRFQSTQQFSGWLGTSEAREFQCNIPDIHWRLDAE